jgi:hypothetical protein
MKRTLMMATAAALLGFGAVAYAQAPQATPPGVENPRGERMERRAERMEQRMNQRIQKLKGDLKLNPQQEALWAPVQAQLAKMQAERRSFRQANAGRFRSAELPERMDMMADRQARAAQNMRELSAAVRPLWVTLSDEQKEAVRKAMPGRGREGRGERGR